MNEAVVFTPVELHAILLANLVSDKQIVTSLPEYVPEEYRNNPTFQFILNILIKTFTYMVDRRISELDEEVETAVKAKKEVMGMK